MGNISTLNSEALLRLLNRESVEVLLSTFTLRSVPATTLSY